MTQFLIPHPCPEVSEQPSKPVCAFTDRDVAVNYIVPVAQNGCLACF